MAKIFNILRTDFIADVLQIQGSTELSALMFTKKTIKYTTCPSRSALLQDSPSRVITKMLLQYQQCHSFNSISN